MWKPDNGTKAMLTHIRSFAKAMLQFYEASLVTGPAKKKAKTAGMPADLDKYWAQKGCKSIHWIKQDRGVREEYWLPYRKRVGPDVHR